MDVKAGRWPSTLLHCLTARPSLLSRLEHRLVSGSLLVAVQLLDFAPDELAAHAGLSGAEKVLPQLPLQRSTDSTCFLPR